MNESDKPRISGAGDDPIIQRRIAKEEGEGNDIENVEKNMKKTRKKRREKRR